MRSYRILVAAGYISILILSLLVGYMYHNEQHSLVLLEEENNRASKLRKNINQLNMQITGLSLLGETVAEWNEKDAEQYHHQRMVIDSTLCVFREVFSSERIGIDSIRDILAHKERLMRDLAEIHSRQRILNRRIADRVPVIVRQSANESPYKAKRKGFLGLFGKKEGAKPSATTSMLHSLNNDVIAGQKVQNRILSEQTDSLIAHNAILNSQLRLLIRQIDCNVQSDLKLQESKIAAMRKMSFIQIGGLALFILLLLLVLFIVIHRDAIRIKRYKRESADLIRQLKQSALRNEELITSRKKAVHTITHELRTPLTAIIGYAGLMQKDCDVDKIGSYIQNIQQSRC